VALAQIELETRPDAGDDERPAKLKDKIQNALDEARKLVLGSQVLLGLQYQMVFEPGFAHRDAATQAVGTAGLALLLATVGLLLLPAVHHRLVESGEDSEEQHRITTAAICLALLPLAAAIGCAFHVALQPTLGATPAAAVALGAVALALGAWYGVEWIDRQKLSRRRGRSTPMTMAPSGSSAADLSDRIRHVLTEARVVLPGAQALLGFAFTTTLLDAFERLPASSKYAHFAGLVLVAVCVILLMMPAAYHRLVEDGNQSEAFHRLAGRLVVAAMVPLALGLAAEFYVVLRAASGSLAGAAAGAGLLLMLFYGLWFQFAFWRRRQRLRAERRGSA